MQNMSIQFPIYPSQLTVFKEKAKALAAELAKVSPGVRLSAFKRNDYLANALGYKGHSDLVKSAHFRVSSDDGSQLIMFSDDVIKENIIGTFIRKIPELTHARASLCCLKLSDSTSHRESLSVNDMLAKASFDELSSVIRGLTSDTSRGQMWVGRASFLIRGILMILLAKRDEHALAITIQSIRDNLTFDNVEALALALLENGNETHPLVDYYVELTVRTRVVTGVQSTYVMAREQHGYFCMYVHESLSLISES
jgi:hypothetical protein